MGNLLEVTCDSVVFKARSGLSGVATGYAADERLADRMAEEVGSKVVGVEGTEEDTTYYFDRTLTEDEVEQLMEHYYKHFYGVEE
jgi:hypothetical protein